MNLQYRTVPFHVKEITDAGQFSGYASVFDNLDYYRDVVRPGAFVESLAKWKAEGAFPPVLWQHDSYCPIGPHTDMREDAKGLYVEGELLISEEDANPEARKAYGLLKRKVIRGMSIGFDIAEGGQVYDGKTNVWNLVKVDLWENSIVTFAANDMARVEDVKRIASGLPISEFEDLLRDVAGLSRSKAKQVAGLAYNRLLRDAGGDPLRDVEREACKAADFGQILNYLQR